MKKEHLGAFIDAIYAVAITMLALEIPVELKVDYISMLHNTLKVFIEYSLSFFMLFSFWAQHRLLNELLPSVTHSSIWITAAILLMVPVIPRVTTLVFEYGSSPGTIFNMDFSELVDLLFIFTILIIDLLIGQLVLKICTPKLQNPDYPQIRHLKHIKWTITGMIIAITVAILFIPFADSNLLWLIVAILFLQNDLDWFIEQFFKLKKLSKSQK